MFDRFKLTVARWEEGANMILAQMLGQGNEDDDETAERVDDAPLLGQLGFAVFPVVRSTLRGLGWRHGNEVWILELWDKARKILDMEEGETRVYAVGDEDTRIRFRADETVSLEAKSIKLGRDATRGAARLGDKTINGTIVFTAPPATPGVVVITYTPPGGSPQITVLTIASPAGIAVAVTSGPTIDLSGKINEGSEKTSIE